jgi:hypothetical protein
MRKISLSKNKIDIINNIISKANKSDHKRSFRKSNIYDNLLIRLSHTLDEDATTDEEAVSHAQNVWTFVAERDFISIQKDLSLDFLSIIKSCRYYPLSGKSTLQFSLMDQYYNDFKSAGLSDLEIAVFFTNVNINDTVNELYRAKILQEKQEANNSNLLNYPGHVISEYKETCETVKNMYGITETRRQNFYEILLRLYLHNPIKQDISLSYQKVLDKILYKDDHTATLMFDCANMILSTFKKNSNIILDLMCQFQDNYSAIHDLGDMLELLKENNKFKEISGDASNFIINKLKMNFPKDYDNNSKRSLFHDHIKKLINVGQKFDDEIIVFTDKDKSEKMNVSDCSKKYNLAAVDELIFLNDVYIKLGTENIKDANALKLFRKYHKKVDNFLEFQNIYLQSLETPDPYFANYTVEKNGLVGRFLPRKDSRYPYVGVITGCCQNFNGLARNAMKDSMVNPNSGIFIVEDNKSIVCQAYVWQSKGTVTFDSFEHLPADTSEQKDKINLAVEVLIEMAKKFDTYVFCGPKKVSSYYMTRNIKQPEIKLDIFPNSEAKFDPYLGDINTRLVINIPEKTDFDNEELRMYASRSKEDIIKNYNYIESVGNYDLIPYFVGSLAQLKKSDVDRDIIDVNFGLRAMTTSVPYFASPNIKIAYYEKELFTLDELKELFKDKWNFKDAIHLINLPCSQNIKNLFQQAYSSLDISDQSITSDFQYAIEKEIIKLKLSDLRANTTLFVTAHVTPDLQRYFNEIGMTPEIYKECLDKISLSRENSAMAQKILVILSHAKNPNNDVDFDAFFPIVYKLREIYPDEKYNILHTNYSILMNLDIVDIDVNYVINNSMIFDQIMKEKNWYELLSKTSKLSGVELTKFLCLNLKQHHITEVMMPELYANVGKMKKFEIPYEISELYKHKDQKQLEYDEILDGRDRTELITVILDTNNYILPKRLNEQHIENYALDGIRLNPNSILATDVDLKKLDPEYLGDILSRDYLDDNTDFIRFDNCQIDLWHYNKIKRDNIIKIINVTTNIIVRLFELPKYTTDECLKFAELFLTRTGKKIILIQVDKSNSNHPYNFLTEDQKMLFEIPVYVPEEEESTEVVDLENVKEELQILDQQINQTYEENPENQKLSYNIKLKTAGKK